MKAFNIDAEVTPSNAKFGYRVKVWDKELGIYINGMMVYPPNSKYPEWGVVPPGVPRQKGKFVVEFNKQLPLWEEVKARCIEVAQVEHLQKKDEVVDEVVTDFDEEKPISLDDIPF
jgi:hypothetical protein